MVSLVRSFSVRIWLSAAYAVMIVGMPCLAFAQAAQPVRGVVQLPDGAPAAGSVVRLRGTSRESVADAAGRFSFDGVRPGRYEVVATLNGYQTVVSPVTVGDSPIEVTLRLAALAISERVDVFGAIHGDTAVMKNEMPIEEVPYSVSVLPAARFELQKAQSLNEVLRYTAGVQSEQYGGLDQAFDFLTIRGFGGSSLNGLFRDGGRLFTFGFLGFRLEPYGAESIDVLRGAASVLYGQASPGGVINFSSKRPTGAPLREVSFEAGSFNHFQGKFDFGGPLGQSAFRYRLTGVVRDAGTQVDFQPNDRLFIAPALSWNSANTVLTVLGHFQRDLTQHFQFLPQVGTAVPSAYGVVPPSRADGEPGFDQFERHQGSAGYILEHQQDGWTLLQSTRFDRVSVDYRDVFGLGLDPADPSQRLMDRATYTAGGFANVITVDGQAQRTLTHGTIRHSVVTGVEYQRSHFDETDGFGDAPPLDLYSPVYGAAVTLPPPVSSTLTKRNNAAAFASDRVRFDNGLSITAGGRYNAIDDHIDDHLSGTSSEEDDRRFTWQAGAAFTTHAGVVPYASYSESFLPVAGRDLAGVRFKPESGQQYEAGVRLQRSSTPGLISVALFDLRRQNVQTPDPANPANQVQTGEVRSRGVEVEAEWALPENLALTAAYTYQDVNITKSNAGNLGFRPPVVPAQMWSTWLQHRVQSGRLNGLGAGIGLRFQGATLDAANTFETPGFTLLDAVGSYTMHGLRFAVNAQNLLDKEFVAGCSGGTCYFGRVRTIYGSTTYAW